MTIKNDVYQQVTTQIIETIEAGNTGFQLPWHRMAAGMPVNISSGNSYNGINVVALWAAEMEEGYDASVWGTYKQWAAKGAQVKKGEKASRIVFYKPLEIEDKDSGELKKIPMAMISLVFNVAQVEGYTEHKPETQPINASFDVNRLVLASGAEIEHRGQTACYIPAQDKILMPEKNLFVETETRSVTAGYYATLFHELTHWTGAQHRCDREQLMDRSSDVYAFEELVAELGAAFLCGEFGLSCEGREDHAGYIAHWLDAMKGDNRLIFKAAAQARKAVEYLKQVLKIRHSTLNSFNRAIQII